MDKIKESFRRLRKDMDSIKEEIFFLRQEISKNAERKRDNLDKEKIKLKQDTFHSDREVREKLSKFILHTEQLSMGHYCKKFEEEFSMKHGREYSILFNSGSSANLALIQALLNLGILKKGDAVGFSALTWSTNVMPLIQLGLNPIPIDVSLKNLNVNLKNILEMKRKIKVLFITNLLGFSGDLNNIKRFCEKEGIILLEDNCESLGSELKENRLGNFGLASTMSFFVGHHLSTIEGGMVSTDDEELRDELVAVREHGWGRGLEKVKQLKLKEKYGISDFHEPYTFYTLGYNLRPTEITGFLGCEQIKYLEHIYSQREKNFKRFLEVAKRNSDLIQFDFSHMKKISNFAYPLVFKNKETFEKYKQKFSEEVEIRPIVAGNMVEQPFFIKNQIGTDDYPNAKQIHRLGFYFPNREDLTEGEIKTILNLLKK